MKYVGQMPTALINDKQIRPTEYRKWAHAHQRFEQRDKDRKVLAELKESIPKCGLKKPIILGIDDRYHGVYVADGHHRAVALRDLGVESFSFNWYWIRSFGVHMEHEPFPYHLVDLQPC